MSVEAGAVAPMEASGLAKKERKSRDERGLPKGIHEKAPGKYQARLTWKEDGKWKQRFISGVFVDIAIAVAALAEAQEKFDQGGTQAVWKSEPSADRNHRGEVCAACGAL